MVNDMKQSFGDRTSSSFYRWVCPSSRKGVKLRSPLCVSPQVGDVLKHRNESGDTKCTKVLPEGQSQLESP